MADKVELNARLVFWKKALEGLQGAYLSLIEGEVQSFTLGDKVLTRLDLPELKKQIVEAEDRVTQLTVQVKGGKPRRAFGVVPRG